MAGDVHGVAIEPLTQQSWGVGRVAGVYLLFLVVFAVPFGLLFGLLLGRWLSAVVGGAFFGLFMSGLFGSLVIYARRNEGVWLPRQTGRMTLPYAVSEVEKRALAALHAMRAHAARVVEPGVIVGRTRVSWRSWGEHLRVEARATEGGSEVIIVSRPTIKTTLVDYGKGRRNIAQLASNLHADLPTDG